MLKITNERQASRARHLVFMAHLWACLPFLIFWIRTPWAHEGIPSRNYESILGFLFFVIGYFVIRTVLAFQNPRWLKWQYVFPPIDVGITSLLIYLGSRDPLSNISLLYFFPLAEAAATFDVFWAITVAVMVVGTAALATHGLESKEPFNATFRYYFIFVVASLLAWLSRIGVRWREFLSVEKDRQRIALEMHDGVQGHLMGVTANLELAKRLPPNSERLADVLSQTQEASRLAADELRFLVQRMRTPALEEGFLQALAQFGHNLTQRHGMEFEFQSSPIPRLSVDEESALFRIAQEAITNAIKHSGASRIVLALGFADGGVFMSVADNGVGFDAHVASPGLDGMRARAAAIAAKLTVDSGRKGTVLRVSASPRSI